MLEFLVTLAVIAVLAAIGVSAYVHYIDRARGVELMLKYDAIRTASAVAIRNQGNTVLADCADLRMRLDSSRLTDPHVTLSYAMQATHDGYRPVLAVCADASLHGVPSVRMARAVLQELGRNGVVEPAYVLSDSIVSFALRLSDGDTAWCKTATAQAPACASGTPAVQTDPQAPQQLTPSSGPASDPNSAKPPTCAPTQELSADQTSCVLKRCPNGQHLDPDGSCFTIPTCAPTQIPSADLRTCVPKTCTAGQLLSDLGVCFHPPSCAPTQELSADRSRCVLKTCASGLVPNAQGHCVPVPNCLPMQQLSPDGGSCVPKRCPANLLPDPQGNCSITPKCGYTGFCGAVNFLGLTADGTHAIFMSQTVQPGTYYLQTTEGITLDVDRWTTTGPSQHISISPRPAYWGGTHILFSSPGGAAYVDGAYQGGGQTFPNNYQPPN